MLIRRILSVEFLPACLTGDLRCPMPNGSHVLVRRILRVKFFGTSLAFEERRPVICVVHVLIASTLGTEGGRAGLALVHLGE